MKMPPLTDFYNRIMFAETEDEIEEISQEIQTAIISRLLDQDKDIIILNLALQIKANYFFIKELRSRERGNTTIIIAGADDFDPEELQLEEFKQEELEEVKKGNVVSLKDFNKKKDE